MTKMAYIDTRFYVTVCPACEYLVPSTSKLLCDVIFGSGSARSVTDNLERLASLARPNEDTKEEKMRPRDDPVEEEEMEEGEEARRSATEHIETSMASVLAQLDDYLREQTHAWIDHVRNIQSTVLRTVRGCDRDLTVSTRLASGVERRIERKRIENELDSVLQRLQAIPLPVVRRSDALVTGIETLRCDLGNAKRVLKTRHLTRLKQSFERQILLLQQPITQDFVECATRILEELRGR